MEGVRAAARGNGLGAAVSLGQGIIEAVRQHAAGYGLQDDMTLVCLGRAGSS
jgi:hypothetical protein